MPKLKEINSVAKAFRKEHKYLRQASNGECYFLKMLEDRVDEVLQRVEDRMAGVTPIRAHVPAPAPAEAKEGDVTCPFCEHPQESWAKNGTCRKCHRKIPVALLAVG